MKPGVGGGGGHLDSVKVKRSHLSRQRSERERERECERAPASSWTSALAARTPEKSQSPSLWTVGAISSALFIFTVSHKNFNSFHRPFIFLGGADRCLRIPQLPRAIIVSGRVSLNICSRRGRLSCISRARLNRCYVQTTHLCHRWGVGGGDVA